jgi:hypothetical protein
MKKKEKKTIFNAGLDIVGFIEAQGLPWVLPIKTCLALKGLQGWEMRMVWIGGQSSPYGNGPFRAHSVGELTQGKPWAKLSWPFGPQTATLNRYRVKTLG